PIDTQVFFKEEKSEARKRFNLPANKKLLLFGAANIFDERKGYKYFVEALNLLKKNLPETEFPEIVFFGKIKADAIDIPFNYHILNYIGNSTDLRLLYSAADLFIIPSLEDNLPNTIMESMACGTPVVAFATGGIPEMIDHLQNGFLAETTSSAQLAQGIEQLLYNENLAEYSKNAIRKVETSYSEKVVAEQYISVYKSAISAQ
ncbi:MAG TPA: glycosyl transferase, partial [Bacteroidales bacterium]|nr:glycosyl transferase [Bacteroidales bacterium]